MVRIQTADLLVAMPCRLPLDHGDPPPMNLFAHAFILCKDCKYRECRHQTNGFFPNKMSFIQTFCNFEKCTQNNESVNYHDKICNAYKVVKSRAD